jgi:hypothetical protein
MVVSVNIGWATAHRRHYRDGVAGRPWLANGLGDRAQSHYEQQSGIPAMARVMTTPGLSHSLPLSITALGPKCTSAIPNAPVTSKTGSRPPQGPECPQVDITTFSTTTSATPPHE